MGRFFGIQFPFKKGAQSMPSETEDDDLIRQSLIQIVMTPKGERVMRPDFGADAISLVFDSTGEGLDLDLKNSVLSAISQYEPRVIVQAISVTTADSDVTVDIAYVVVTTQESQRLSLTFPAA